MLKRLLPLIILAIGVAGFVFLKATRPEPAEVSDSERSWQVDVQSVQPVPIHRYCPCMAKLWHRNRWTLPRPWQAALRSDPCQRARTSGGDLLLALSDADIAQARAQRHGEHAEPLGTQS
ncbi:MAG: hypothetical protein SV598_03620 [Pseudomonadota bacterium]|nr:hypothetical protein [Pseudomonadota bacterium]